MPQTIYLSDTTVAENIAIGEEKDKIDFIRLYDSCKRAGILDFVQSLENGFEFIVGERGEGFSGGQRQRPASWTSRRLCAAAGWWPSGPVPVRGRSSGRAGSRRVSGRTPTRPTTDRQACSRDD